MTVDTAETSPGTWRMRLVSSDGRIRYGCPRGDRAAAVADAAVYIRAANLSREDESRLWWAAFHDATRTPGA